MSNLKQLATQYFEMFSNKDLDGLSEMFTEDVVLRDWERSASGKAGMLAANKAIFDSVDTITVTPTALYEENSTVVAEIEILVNNEIKLLVVDVIKFEDNKISSVVAYKGY
jgi:ketosteroid isomerase-like protein